MGPRSSDYEVLLGNSVYMTTKQLVARQRFYKESTIHTVDIFCDTISRSVEENTGKCLQVATIPMSSFGITISPTDEEYSQVVEYIVRRVKRATGYSFVRKRGYIRGDNNSSWSFGFICNCTDCMAHPDRSLVLLSTSYPFGVLFIDYFNYNGFIRIDVRHPNILVNQSLAPAIDCIREEKTGGKVVKNNISPHIDPHISQETDGFLLIEK